jgi:MYXO-CTERM domain-containing protein
MAPPDAYEDLRKLAEEAMRDGERDRLKLDKHVSFSRVLRIGVRQNESAVSSRNLKLSEDKFMKRVPHLLAVLLLTVVGFAQPPDTSSNPDTSTRNAYNRPVPVENGSSHGNWGWLGLLGLAGLLGRRRRETTVHTLDEFSTEQRRRAS